MRVEWTDYIKYKARLRGFEIARIEEVVIGHHDGMLVIVPYEVNQDLITPITIHATTRQQIRFRIQTGRYTLE